MKRIFPNSFYNLITLIGGVISGICFALILFLMLLEFFAATSKPYVGIIAFVILPSILLIGIAIMIFGIIRESKRERDGKDESRLPALDLNNPRHRTAFIYISLGTIILLIFSAFGSFQAYEYTESDEFCGTTCHTVMEPEYTAYQYSPHARVGCVQCHIGPGTGWFVRSKLSGTYQLYAVAFNKYPKPIPTPIQNLRPAQETCEQCHWPKHFYSEKQHTNTYFVSDEQNTQWNLTLLMKVGGGNAESGVTSGIHAHMNIANEITYAHSDTQRQNIPWVRSKRPDGTVLVFRSKENPISDADAQKMEKRRMDCIDCHNRPSHIYHPPARSINHVIALGWIDKELPGVKSICIRALEAPYATRDEGLKGIERTIRDFYESNHPEISAKKKEQISRTITETQKIYKRTYFPEMKVSWKKFNNNIGHLYYAGCFRCHDGKHVTDDGKVISRDCNVCHTLLAQKTLAGKLLVDLGGIEYKHPVDIGNSWKEMNCSDCHNSQ